MTRSQKWMQSFAASDCKWPVSDWFSKYCEDAELSFMSSEGWPVPKPVAIGNVLHSLLAQFLPSPEQIEAAAASIYFAASQGAEVELPRNRPAKPDQTDAQLINLHKLCSSLARYIERLNRPAIDALQAEGTDILALGKALREAQENAEHAFGGYEPGPLPVGRPPKHEASNVTISTAYAYFEITGLRPKFTTDSIGSEISGLWPEVLGAVFQALGTDASVESQMRKLQKEIPKADWVVSEKTPPWETP